LSTIVSFNLFFNTPTTFNFYLNKVENLPIIAVDPEVIPLYSIVEIEDLGAFIALDTGGLIKGNRIDILFDS
jgi:3D (Asp-Asp-Asp) domain-containing protein